MDPLTPLEIHHLWELLHPLRPDLSITDIEAVLSNANVGPSYRIDFVKTRVEVTMPDAFVSMQRFT